MSVESVVEACVYLVTTTYTIKTTADRVISPRQGAHYECRLRASEPSGSVRMLCAETSRRTQWIAFAAFAMPRDSKKSTKLDRCESLVCPDGVLI